MLKIFHDSNGSFIDYTNKGKDYVVDSFPLEMVAVSDYLYLGLYKPFTSVYIEMGTANTVAQSFTAEYYNGTSWTDLSDFVDNSEGFTRSGFLNWSNEDEDWESSEINSIDKHWIRLKPSEDFSAGTIVKGLNIVFSDDNDLKEEVFSILEYLQDNQSSFISYHQGARKDIVSAIRRDGKIKIDEDSNRSNITEWDFLDIDEIRNSSKYHVLSKIFFDASDNIDDKYYQRYRDYKSKYLDEMSLFALTLDTDDDGIIGDSERLDISRIEVCRV